MMNINIDLHDLPKTMQREFYNEDKDKWQDIVPVFFGRGLQTVMTRYRYEMADGTVEYSDIDWVWVRCTRWPVPLAKLRVRYIQWKRHRR